jgi:1-acyl-sn-glycerol-3-phosphate acyltransferase
MTDWYKPEDAIWSPAVGSALFEGFCRMFFRCYCLLTVEGHHHLPDGPFLLCSNHASHIDSAALMTASGRRFRDFAMVGASDYFFQSWSVRSMVSPFMNVIPIDRRPGARSLAGCLTNCQRFLEQTGGGLILYPEGTRSPDGEMREFKSGVGFFASKLGVPLVPAYIEGTHQVLPKGRSVPCPGAMRVRFGEPLTLARPSGNGTSLRDWRCSVVEQLRQEIKLLSFGFQHEELAAVRE